MSNFVMPVSAQNGTSSADSIEVSLLTCSPHEEIYSLYGHSALRYHDLRTGEDLAFNYGIFSFKKPFFVLRFALGKTDYELGVVPFEVFKREYRKFGSQVVEQVLNISAEEKMRIYNALLINYRPENRVYRYNFFYDNCTTRARDIIERNINGKIVYAFDNDDYIPTYREIIHEHTIHHPWAKVGNDMCLGFKADVGISQREQQFIPSKLMRDFDNAQIYNNGEYRPLIKERNIVVAPGVQIVEEEFPLSPIQCASVLFVVSLILCVIEYKKNIILKLWDVVLMISAGLSGCIILILLFSEHPTTSSNLQALILNPVHLIFIHRVIKGKTTVYWKLLTIMVILFVIGSFFQNYADGMMLVALSLLSRCWIHLRHLQTTRLPK